MSHPREIIARIRARCDNATDGPWDYQRSHDTPSGWQDAYVLGADGESVVSEVSDWNAKFIAHARTDVPAFLAAVDAVLDLADQLDAEQEAMHDFYSWPRDDSERPEAPSARIRSTITQALEGDTP